VTDHLTALDAAFLELEESDASAHMHIGWTMVFDPLPGGGSPSVEDLRRLLEERLSLLPRFRRPLSMPNVGALSWPTWVADQEFEIDARVPHATLPEPGGRRELLEWLASFYSRRLDRTLPLWGYVAGAGHRDSLESSVVGDRIRRLAAGGLQTQSPQRSQQRLVLG
jgi:diacylglycerol O-acyltransferase / wax synthase